VVAAAAAVATAAAVAAAAAGRRVRVCIGPARWVSRSAVNGKRILEPIASSGDPRYRCVANCTVRAAAGRESARVGILRVGAEVTALRECVDGDGWDRAEVEVAVGGWSCATCTLANRGPAADCAACGLPRGPRRSPQRQRPQQHSSAVIDLLSSSEEEEAEDAEAEAGQRQRQRRRLPAAAAAARVEIILD
jgi:hypothetical protein